MNNSSMLSQTVQTHNFLDYDFIIIEMFIIILYQ